jgi:hypothetical protein
MGRRRLIGSGHRAAWCRARLAVVVCVALPGCVGLAACGGATGTTPTTGTAGASTAGATQPPRTVGATHRHRVTGSGYPRLQPVAESSAPTSFVPAMTWRGRTAVWIARRGGVAVLSFDQALVVLHLHSGTVDAGPSGWRWGPEIGRSERRLLVAAFNGGFKFATRAGGFESYGRVGSPLQPSLASIVTYADGDTQIGVWHRHLPAPGRHVVAVRQNLRLLLDGGRPTADLNCLLCWGATLSGVSDPARSALGITADGHLIWVGGEHLTVSELDDALLGARVVRAVELDINPEWVAGYLYGHRGGRGLAAVPIAPGQQGVPGQFMAPYQRDFFVVVAR